LSSIAHAYIHDKVPELLRHEIGFQLVERSDDENRAVGVFGFKIGKILLYVPVFFINGKIKGLDLLYIYNDKIFVPLSQEFINFVKRNQFGSLGRPSDRIEGIGRVLYPNLMQLKPQTLKWASSLPNWLFPFAYDLINFKSNPKHSIEFPEVQQCFKNLIKDGHASRFLISYLDRFPARIKDLYEIYGGEFEQLVKAAGQYLKKFPEEIRDYSNKKRGKTTTTNLDRTEQEAEVEIFTNIDDAAAHNLTEEQVQQLLTKGYLILDKRETHNSMLILDPIRKFKAKRQFSSTIRPGFNYIVMLDGSFERVFIAPIKLEEAIKRREEPITTIEQKRPEDLRKERNCLVIFVNRGNRAAILPQHMILTISEDEVRRYKNGELVKENKDDFEDFNSVKNLNPNKKAYYCIFTRVESTPPVCLSTSEQDIYGRKVLSYISRNVIDLNHDWGGEFYYNDKIIVDPRTTEIQSVKEMVEGRYKHVGFIVPPTAKYVELSAGNNENGKSIPPTMPVHYLMDFLAKHADRSLEIKKIGNYEFSVNNKPVYLDQFLKFLVKDAGLSEENAIEVIDAVTKRGSITLLVKAAQELSPYPKTPPVPGATPLPDVSATSGVLGTRETRTPVHGMATLEQDINRNFPSFSDPLEPGGTVDQHIRSAIQTGQKEVLDISLFSEMLSAVDDRDIIERYLPDLMKGLDALGRILFNLYLHYDAFEDRYGQDQIPGLEQNLRFIFNRLGKIILDLEKRPVIPEVDYLKSIGLRNS
jgi:hypothetical protein